MLQRIAGCASPGANYNRDKARPQTHGKLRLIELIRWGDIATISVRSVLSQMTQLLSLVILK